MSRLLFLAFSLFFNLIGSSNGVEENDSFNSSCPSHQCGSVNISYPFWHWQEIPQTQYCGYQGFGVTCESGEATLHIGEEEAPQIFYVTDINYSERSLSLVDADTRKDQSCPRASRNLTFDALPLNYSHLDRNLSFYSNCKDEPVIPFPIGCLGSGVHRTYVFVEGTEPGDVDWHDYCEERVMTTVMKRNLKRDDQNVSNWFGEAMRNGFVLNWGDMTGCEACEESDGRCGFDFDIPNSARQGVWCFCPDGSRRKDHCRGDRSKVGLKIGIGFAAAGGTLLFVGLVFFICRRRNKKKHYATSPLVSRNISYPSSSFDLEQANSYMGVQMFSYSELEEATDNFDSKKELGSGGFGIVYKGKLRDGRTVAIKRLFESNYKRVEQFMNEVEILKRLRHRNLVSLYGCTSRHCRELILVYEYIPNGTVADHLHGEQAKPGSLTWATRMNIAVETAAALAYLHASDVIHRDVKTNNILLDQNFFVKVADFGLSRFFPNNVTHVSTAPQGTPGYVDPEYHQCYHLTEKSDVYSFGVVLFELISSMPAVDITRKRHEINLSNMAVNKIQTQALHELVDPSLGFESDDKVNMMISAVAELAFQCLHYEREMRPTMEVVLEGLKGIQKEDYHTQKTQVHIPADDDVLLKSDQVMLSPDSVTTKWISVSTTSNSSC